ncbi:MAG: hypothetical protein IKZ41_01510, partial [Clostridia bacterium]|nr:hypothetical protein [Clostridia bacterium]
YCPIGANEEQIAAVQTACASAERLAYQEMVKHEFVDGNIRRQRATFSDGTVTEIDLDTGDFRIIPAEG